MKGLMELLPGMMGFGGFAWWWEGFGGGRGIRGAYSAPELTCFCRS